MLSSDKQKIRKKYQQKWKKNPEETCPKDEHGNNRNITCFVPSCCNRMWKDGKKNRRLLFFKVPDGLDGLLWTKAIRKIGTNKYKQLLKVVTMTDAESTNPYNSQYCCEAHFDIRQDIEINVGNNGYVEYKVRSDVFPSVQRRQKERLVHILNETPGDFIENCEMKNEIVISDESMTGENALDTHDLDPVSTKSSNEVSTNDFPSIVDVYTLNEEQNLSEAPQVYYEIRTLDDEQQTDINCEPIPEMLPLTIALMKRKSLYYMGLKADSFANLLEISRRRKMPEMQIMLTLRKLRLKEEFETLGDLFDLDKTRTEEYFNRYKYRVAELVGKLTPTTGQPTIQLKRVIKVKQNIKHESLPAPNDDNNAMNDHDETNSTETSDFSVYYDSEADPEVKVANLGQESCTSEDYSDENYDSDEPKKFVNLDTRTCGLCFENFETVSLLQRHQKNIHRGAYLCDLCGKIYFSKRSVKYHILTVHAKVKEPYYKKNAHVPIRNVKCNLCDVKFVDQHALDYHFRAKHTYIAPFKCKDCDKTFIKENNYKAHEQAHIKDKFVCDICFQEFNFKPYLQTHLKSIHGRC